jgi:hypothetical protein
MFKEDYVLIPTQRSRIPRFCLDSPVMRPNAHQRQEAEQFKVAIIRTSWQHVQTHFRVREELGFSFTDTYMERQLHPSGRQGNTVRTRCIIRQDVEKNCNRLDARATLLGRGPYYGNYVQQSCNRPNAKATSSGRGLNMESVRCVIERRLHSCSSRQP